MFSVLLTVITGGGWLEVEAMLIEVAKGVILGIGFGVIGTLCAGEKLTWEGLGNAVVDSFLITSAFVFISTAFNAIKYICRSKPVTTAELKSYELDPRSVELAKQGDPSWGTFRRRVWKNEATFRPELYDDQVARMSKGLAPQVNGKSMHLHHVVGKANDMYNVIKVTQAQHIAIHQAIGYHYNAMWTLESIAHLL